MKAKKLMTLCLVGILAVATISSTVFAAESTYSGSETPVTYVPNGSGPSGPIDSGNADTDPNNWIVYYDRLVDLSQDNILGVDDTFTTTDKVKDFSFTVKRQVPGKIGDASTGGTDGLTVSDQNLGAAASGDGSPTYTGTTASLKVTATKTGNGWNQAGYIEMSSNNLDGVVPQMSIRTSGAIQVTNADTAIATLAAGATNATDTPAAAITGGMTSGLVDDGSSYSVNLTYTFTAGPIV